MIQPIDVLYEDNHLIALNKNVSDIVQGDKTGDEPLSEKVKQYLRVKYNKPGNVFVGVTHRLDRPVSGVVLFARTSKALARLNKMFSDKQNLKKKYWALVKNKPPATQGCLTDYLVKNQGKNKSFVTGENTDGAKKAVLNYKVVDASDNFYLLEIELVTGRHHQIRVQLANMGCPIKGDLKYGFPRSNRDAGICLHARTLEIIHPVKKENMVITAPVPNDTLWKYFEERNA